MRINLSDAKFPGRQERMVGRDGFLNASSQKEALQSTIQLLSAMAQGEVASDEEVLNAEQRNKILVNAYNDNTGVGMAEIASDIIAEITTRQERVGFMRNFLARGSVAQNSIARVHVKHRNVTAVVVKGPVQIYEQIIRDDYFFIDEFAVVARPRITQKDINQGSASILDDKFYEAIEATQVTEDRVFMKATRKAAGLENPKYAFTGDFTPTILRATQQLVGENNLPVSSVLMSDDLVKELINPSFMQVIQYTPHQAELIATGRLGSIFGVELVTDSVRQSRFRVLEKGEIIAFAPPENLGVYIDRGPVESRPAEVFEKDTMTKGWDMWEHIGLFLANSRAVGYAKRS